jgi:hypothetical protein
MLTIKDWLPLAKQGRLVIALESYAIDRESIFNFFGKQAKEQQLSVYYWNLGYNYLQLLDFDSSKLNNLH